MPKLIIQFWHFKFYYMESTNRLSARCSESGVTFSIKRNYEVEYMVEDGKWELHPMTKIINYYKSLIEDFGLEIQFEFENSYMDISTLNSEYFVVNYESLYRLTSRIIFKYNDVVIKNKYGKSTKLGTMYVVIAISLLRVMIFGFRTEIQYSHAASNYHHSHTKTSAIGSYSYDTHHFCTGSYTGMGNLLSEYRKLMWDSRGTYITNNVAMRLLFENKILDWAEAIRGMILPMISTESIDGGPYIQMSNIANSGNIYNKAFTDETVSNRILKVITDNISQWTNLKFTCDNFNNIKISNPQVLIKYLHDNNHHRLLYADIGEGYVKFVNNSTLSEYQKEGIKQQMARMRTPFKWNGEYLQITLIEDDANVTRKEPTLPKRIIADIEVGFSSIIRQLQKSKWIANNLSSVNDNSETYNIEQIVEYDTPIAYPTS